MSDVHVVLGQTAISPGEQIAGSVRVDGHWTGERELEARLVWETAGKGTTDTSTMARHTLSVNATSPSARFSMNVPMYPWTYNGTLLSIGWRIDIVDAKTCERVATADFVCAPCARPVTNQIGA